MTQLINSFEVKSNNSSDTLIFTDFAKRDFAIRFDELKGFFKEDSFFIYKQDYFMDYDSSKITINGCGRFFSDSIYYTYTAENKSRGRILEAVGKGKKE